MSEVALTSIMTVLIGVSVYVGGQVFIKFFIEPIHEQRKFIGKIAYSLIIYAKCLITPGIGKSEKIEEASSTLEQEAGLLRELTSQIPYYSFFTCLKLVRKANAIDKTSVNLRRLSISVRREGEGDYNEKLIKEIEKLLDIKVYLD